MLRLVQNNVHLYTIPYHSFIGLKGSLDQKMAGITLSFLGNLQNAKYSQAANRNQTGQSGWPNQHSLAMSLYEVSTSASQATSPSISFVFLIYHRSCKGILTDHHVIRPSFLSTTRLNRLLSPQMTLKNSYNRPSITASKFHSHSTIPRPMNKKPVSTSRAQISLKK